MSKCCFLRTFFLFYITVLSSIVNKTKNFTQNYFFICITLRKMLYFSLGQIFIGFLLMKKSSCVSKYTMSFYGIGLWCSDCFKTTNAEFPDNAQGISVTIGSVNSNIKQLDVECGKSRLTNQISGEFLARFHSAGNENKNN